MGRQQCARRATAAVGKHVCGLGPRFEPMYTPTHPHTHTPVHSASCPSSTIGSALRERWRGAYGPVRFGTGVSTRVVVGGEEQLPFGPHHHPHTHAHKRATRSDARTHVHDPSRGGGGYLLTRTSSSSSKSSPIIWSSCFVARARVVQSSLPAAIFLDPTPNEAFCVSGFPLHGFGYTHCSFSSSAFCSVQGVTPRVAAGVPCSSLRTSSPIFTVNLIV